MLTLLQEVAPTGRVGRRPKHKFRINSIPYQIVPFMIAPVLPAETLEAYHFEAREVSDPVNSPIIGWNSEKYLFYVKIRDLADRDTLDDMFLNPTASVSALNEAVSVPYYHAGNSPNFTKKALQRITETFFRDEGEAWNNADIGSYPSAQFRDQAWMDSLVDTTLLAAGTGDPGATTTPEALDAMMDAYEQVRMAGFTNMSFEDYLRTFGVSIAKEAVHKPELIASWREFMYPANTINPTDGAPTSALSWVHKKTDRTRKFFKEPGFIIGVSIIRPKVYMTRQGGSLAHFLDKGLSWLPQLMADRPETSLREFTGGAAGTGPLSNGTTGPTNGYWVDMRDLFLYGDQMTNLGLTGSDNGVAIPAADLTRKYLTKAMVDGLFKTAANDFVKADGFCSLTVKGTQRDYTGGHQAER